MKNIVFELPVRRVPAVKPVPQIDGYQFRFPRCGYDAHGFRNEDNDCTVRAAMCAPRLDYPSAHALLKGMGRKDRRGFKMRRVASRLGWVPLGINQGSVQKVVGQLPKDGRYVVKVSGHVFAVADGMVFDHPAQVRRHVREVWQVPVDTGDYQI